MAEQQAESSHLEAQAGGQNGELEISKPTPSNILPPKATPPKPLQCHHELVTEHLGLWGTLLSRPPHLACVRPEVPLQHPKNVAKQSFVLQSRCTL